MSSKELGDRGERLAQAFYAKRGYRLVEANFRTRQGEVDLILKRRAEYVFAEVKTRTAGGIAQPREWVDAKKQRRVMAAALAFLAQMNISEPFMRFDVVEILFNAGGGVDSIRCIEGAFTA